MVLPADQNQFIICLRAFGARIGPKLNQFLSKQKLNTMWALDNLCICLLWHFRISEIRFNQKCFQIKICLHQSLRIFANIFQLPFNPIIGISGFVSGCQPLTLRHCYSLGWITRTWSWVPASNGRHVWSIQSISFIGHFSEAQYHFNEEAFQSKNGQIKNRFNQIIRKRFLTLSSALLITSLKTILLPKNKVSYNESYWSSRSLAPSTLLYFLGFDQLIPNLSHHSLFLMQILIFMQRKYMITQPGRPVHYFIPTPVVWQILHVHPTACTI